MKNLFILIDLSDENTFEYNKNTFLDFANKLGKLNFIDVSKLVNLETKINVKSIDKRFFVVQPKNLKEFKSNITINNSIFMYCINTTFKYFSINFLISRKKVEKFIVSNLGYNPENYNYTKKKILKNLIIFFKLRFFYYIKRFLVIINLLPKIDYFFESSSFVINSINNGLSKKISKILPFLNFSYYKNLVKINSKHYDSVLENRYQISEDFIVFIDGMIIDHKDTKLRENISKENRKKYYICINKFLLELKNAYNKEVIVCLHPNYDIDTAREDYKNFKCIKYKTEEYINKSFLTVFHEGSNIIQAILLKKRIINLYGDLLGVRLNRRCKIYADMLGLKSYDFENYSLEDKKLLIEDLNKITKNYEEYIRNNIVFKKEQKGTDQIINYLNIN